MNKVITKNPIYLGILAVVLNIIFGLIIDFVLTDLLKIDNSPTSVAGIIAMLILGQSYGAKYKEVPSKKLGYQTAAMFIVYQIILLFIIYPSILDILPLDDILLGIAFSFLFIVLILWIYQHIFIYGARSYLKAELKRNVPSV